MSTEIDSKRRSIVRFGCILGVSLLISPLLPADEITDLAEDVNDNEVVGIRVWPSSVYTRITIESDYAIIAKSKLSSNLIIIDLADSHVNKTLQEMPKKVTATDPIIDSIDVSQQTLTSVRISIGLKQEVKLQMQTIEPITLGSVSYQYRYVIDIYPVQHNNSDRSALNDDMLALLQLNSDNSETKPVASSALPQRIYSAPQRKNDNILVMLDPGHGGEDPGAIGPTGVREKNIVLDVSKKLYDIINSSDYMRAELTRNQDIFVPLGTRVAIARRAKADIFISIHADAFTTPQARGASVFMLSDNGASSSFARWLAQTQNDADLIGGMSFKSKDKLTSRILLDMTQTWTAKKSAKLGQALLPRLAEVGRLHNGKVEKAAFAVLKAPDIPSVLVETAFISNPDEEALLNTPEFRQKIAEMIFSGLSNFSKA